MTRPRDPAAAGGARLRAGDADREQVIESLKDAFVQGRLAKDEFDTRAGRALAARTCAELAALTADIPPASAVPAATTSVRPPAAGRRRPLARAAAGSGGCLVIAYAAALLISLADPGATPGPIPKALAGPLILVLVAAVVAALCILGQGVSASVRQRRSRRQPPPRPGPGGHALEAGRRGGTGHGPVPPGPRSDQTRADLRARSSRPGRSRPSGPGTRVPGRVRAVPDAV